MIVHRYDLSAEPGYRLAIDESITLKPRGFRLRLANRHAASRMQPVAAEPARLSA